MVVPACAGAAVGDINLVAGNGTNSTAGDGGQATAASMMGPGGVVFGPAGQLYVADLYGNRIRSIAANGVISTYGGTGTAGSAGDGGQATAATLNQPSDVAIDSAGNLYIPEFAGARVRKITPAGVISTFAGTGTAGYTGDGGAATLAKIGQPIGIAVDSSNNVYIADFNGTVRKVDPLGTITTIAGTGTNGDTGDGGAATAAKINQPGDVITDAAGNLYIGEFTGNRIRKVTPGGIISTIAGTGAAGSTGDGGPATAATLNAPGGLAIDSAGSLFVDEYNGARIRKITAAGIISRIAGTGTAGYSGDGGPALNAKVNLPGRVALTSTGDYYFADLGNHRVRWVAGLGVPDAPVFTAVSPASPAQSTTPSIKGTTSGATVKLYTNSTCASAVAASGTAAAFASPGLAVTVSANSATTFWATTTDTGGNTSGCSSGSISYTSDTIAPVAPTVGSAPASPAQGRSPSWSWTAELGATSSCRLVRGATVVSDWATCTSPASFSLSGQADGVYTFSVRATDAAANTGAAATSTYTLDSTAPAAPSITASPSSPAQGRSPAWSWTAEAGSSTDCRVTSGATVVSDWAACTSGQSFSLAGQPDGGYQLSVRATDGAGNTGTAAVSGAYTLDTTAPAAPSIATAPASPAHDRSPAWSWTAEAGATSECKVTRGATVVSDWATCASGAHADLSGQPDGTYTFAVRATDAAGNTGSTASSTYELDTTPPATPSITGSPSSPAQDRSPTWSWTAESGAASECKITRGATVVSDWAICTSAASFSLAGQADGVYTFSVRATDAASNTSAVATSAYTLDTTAPAAPSITTSPASPAQGRSPAWSWTAEAGATSECRVTRAASVVSDWASCASGAHADLSGQPDGTYTFAVRATDAAGNTGSGALSDYELDTTPPPAPSMTTTPASPAQGRSPAWSWTAEAGATSECKVTRGATVITDWAGCTSGAHADLTGQPDGTYTLAVRATDAAGNTGSAASSDYELDTTAPDAPSITAPPSSPGQGRSPAWSWTAETGSTTECKVTRGATVITDWAGCTSGANADLSGQPDGTYTFAVRATDAAGNTGSTASSDYELDTTAPDAPVIASTPDSPGADHAPAWGWTAEAGSTSECKVTRGATVVSDWATCTSPSAAALSGQPDGTYDFAVRATDAAGNVGPAATSGYVLDTSVPDAPAFSAFPPAAGSSAHAEWAFTAAGASTYECRLDRGATAISSWAACTSPQPYDLSALPDGTYRISVRGLSSAHVRGPVTTGDYGFDTIAPDAPTFTLRPGARGAQRHPAWSFTTEPGAQLDCRVYPAGDPAPAWAACASPAAEDLSARPDGVYRFDVRATDAAGNAGPAAGDTYELDTTAPAAPAITDAPASPASSRRPAWAFSAEAGATTECRLTSAGAAVSDWAPCASPVVYDLTGRGDETYALAVRARDGSGNTGAAATSAYTLDTTPGGVVITSGPAPVTRERHAVFTFTGEGGATFACRFGLVSGASDWAPCTSGSGYDALTTADGDYRLSVRATDPAGNAGDAADWPFTVDTTPPAPPQVSAPRTRAHSPRTPTVVLSTEPGARLECQVESGGAVVTGWATCLSPYTAQLPAADGTYTVVARATDVAGNTSDVDRVDYTLDTTAPLAPTITSEPDSPGSNRDPSWAFRAERGATLECRLAGPDGVVSVWAACTSPTAFDLTGANAGTYTFSVRATDAAGNTGRATDSDYVLQADPAVAADDDSDQGSAPAPATPSQGSGGSAPASPTAAATPAARKADPSSGGTKGTSVSHRPAARDHAAASGHRGATAPRAAGRRSPAAPRAVGHRSRHDSDTPVHHRRRAEPATRKVTRVLAHNLRKAASAVARHPDKAAFPAGLLFLVFGFVSVQGRIDRRDPKLALAPVFADDFVEFTPPGPEPRPDLT